MRHKDAFTGPGTNPKLGTLTHIHEGRARMVDVGAKPVTRRQATAAGFIQMARSTVRRIREQETPKGDPLEAARLAGIMAAKRTADLIPLCHPLPLTHVDVQLKLRPAGIEIRASASTNATTGVEMEALVAASVAALTLYDMCKAIDRDMVIGQICLQSKSGGRSGDYVRKSPNSIEQRSAK